MKTKKMSFKEISGVMSRSEMKKIMAGSGNKCNYKCTQNSDCDTICPFCDSSYPGAGYATCGKS